MNAPEQNTGESCFCFDSNLLGRHGAGAAAKEAAAYWGAIPGVGFGPCGHSFAIPLKDWQIQTLPFEDIAVFVRLFLDYARLNPDKKFLVTALGTALAGYRPDQIALMFRGAPANCTMPHEWKELLKEGA